MTSIPLLISAPYPCSYLADAQAQSVFVNPQTRMTNALYSQLVAHGFRRSGDDVYRPQCAACQQCVAVRIEVQNFKPSRKHKRCWQKNADITAIIKPATFETAHYEMYLCYQNQRHKDGGMAKASKEESLNFLSSTWCETRFVEFSIAGELAGVAVVDYLENSLSAVYTFFEPKFSPLSLGVYAVLWQIEQAKRLGLRYVYLGFWIQNCQKMAYKSQYQPLQGLIHQRWQTVIFEKST